MSKQVTVISIAPYSFIHVLNTNTNVTAVICGPARYTCRQDERVVRGPEEMVKIPPRCYAIVADPVMVDEDGAPLVDEFEQFKLRHGDIEVRDSVTHPSPFPLYPGESLQQNVSQLEVVRKNEALRLRAVRNFSEALNESDSESNKDEDDLSVKRYAGDEWLFRGPGTYFPRVEVVIIDRIKSVVIKENTALRIRAIRATTDTMNRSVQRKAGEEYLIRRSGAYLPSVDEEVVDVVCASIITDKKALQLSAIKTFTDVYGITRKAGEQWLVTIKDSDSHIPDVYENVDGIVNITTLTNREYCVILDPYVDGVQTLGTKRVVKGEASFFLQPGEQLENGIEKVHVLSEDEALLLQAKESFKDLAVKEDRKAGDKWMIHGPIEYIPEISVNVLEKRKAIPLDSNEGVYVRDLTSGQVRAVIGKTYMLKANEELWEKELPAEVEGLLEVQKLGNTYIPPGGANLQCSKGQENMTLKSLAFSQKRDKTRVVKFRVPHNSAIQLYNYKSKASRIAFGPDLVMLMPDEQFSVMRLSGDKPKRPNVITSLNLQLGPDFMTDILVVETSDHARLKLTLSYNWHFDIDRKDMKSGSEIASKIFAVRDFTGDACKAMGSRVRGAVAGVTFDVFHKNSAKIIRASVFGMNEQGKVGDHFCFKANNLVITNIDIQSVEPVDIETRKSLQRSVQMAIQITTNSQEAAAKHSALREEEEAKGFLEQQRLKNLAKAEESKKKLLELQAESAAVETSGQARAEAKSKAEARHIEGQAAVTQAKLESEALHIKFEQEMKIIKAKQEAELAHAKAMIEMEVAKKRQLAEIEANRFKHMIEAIGQETITNIARAGPEMQAKLLSGLGIKSMMITDGKSPINLFQTAQQMISQQGTSSHTLEQQTEAKEN